MSCDYNYVDGCNCVCTVHVVSLKRILLFSLEMRLVLCVFNIL